jgi:hypothetical protein
MKFLNNIFIYMFFWKIYYFESESSLLAKRFHEMKNLDSKRFYENLDPYQTHPYFEHPSHFTEWK